MEPLQLIFIILFIWLALPFSLVMTYLWTRRISIYHLLDCVDPNGESKWTKFKLYLNYNLYFSLIFAITIYITIKTLIPDIDIQKIVLMTIFLDFFLLLTQRVLLHPNRRLVNIIHNTCLHLTREEAVENYRENLLSFLYGFINTAAMISLLLETFNILTNKPLTISDMNPKHADLILSFINFVLCYSLFLVSVTLIGETWLFIIPPEFQKNKEGNNVITNINGIHIWHKVLYVALSITFSAVSIFVYLYLSKNL